MQTVECLIESWWLAGVNPPDRDRGTWGRAACRQSCIRQAFQQRRPWWTSLHTRRSSTWHSSSSPCPPRPSAPTHHEWPPLPRVRSYRGQEGKVSHWAEAHAETKKITSLNLWKVCRNAWKDVRTSCGDFLQWGGQCLPAEVLLHGLTHQQPEGQSEEQLRVGRVWTKTERKDGNVVSNERRLSAKVRTHGWVTLNTLADCQTVFLTFFIHLFFKNQLIIAHRNSSRQIPGTKNDSNVFLFKYHLNPGIKWTHPLAFKCGQMYAASIMHGNGSWTSWLLQMQCWQRWSFTLGSF